MVSNPFAASLLLFITAFSVTPTYAAITFQPADSTAAKLFERSCNSCHQESGQSLAPGRSVMLGMTPRAIYTSLTQGKMRQQGAALSDPERRILSEWLTKRKLTETNLPDSAITKFSVVDNRHDADQSGWGNTPGGSGFRTAEQAGITPANVASLQLKWAFAFPEGTVIRSKPAVFGNWLITGSQHGQLYAINKNTGKIGWQFNAAAPIRGAISIVKLQNRPVAVFADYSTNVYAVDVVTGKQIWNVRAGYEAASANTGSVTVHKNIVFVPVSSAEVSVAFANSYDCCMSSGGVVALNLQTGKRLWTYRIIPKAQPGALKKNGKPSLGPSGAPVWCSPTVDSARGLLYIGTGQNYSEPTTNTSDALQAIDIQTGKLVWNFQPTTDDAYNSACPVFMNCPPVNGPDLDFGMAPILIKTPGADILLAGQKSGVVYALTPTGRLLWKTRIGKGGKLGGIHWGMATDGQAVYATNADNMYAIDTRDTAIKASPGVYALSLDDGRLLWSSSPPPCPPNKICLSGNSAAPLVVPGIVFAGSLDGQIRAHAAKDGKVLWQYNTARDFTSTTGVPGKGGAIDGPAPVAVDGMLFVNSGYGMFGQMPGNVLLAFEVNR